jgi:hypothetical protein
MVQPAPGYFACHGVCVPAAAQHALQPPLPTLPDGTLACVLGACIPVLFAGAGGDPETLVPALAVSPLPSCAAAAGSAPCTLVQLQFGLRLSEPGLQQRLRQLGDMIALGQQGTWLIMEGEGGRGGGRQMNYGREGGWRMEAGLAHRLGGMVPSSHVAGISQATPPPSS